jgi:hypothetical protein
MKIGSFTACLQGAKPFEISALIFGHFAVHDSFGFTGDSKGRVKHTQQKITLSHCPTGLSLELFDNMMDAVFLAQELEKSVPPDVASCTDIAELYAKMGSYFRRATLAIIGRNVGSGIGKETPA